jgi:hypothetical protein
MLSCADAGSMKRKSKQGWWSSSYRQTGLGWSPPGFTIVKHLDSSSMSFEREYSEPLAPRAIALGIAYTFLALNLEANVYRDELEPAREVLRRVIARETEAADSWPISCLRPSDIRPEPRHALALKMEKGGSGGRRVPRAFT